MNKIAKHLGTMLETSDLRRDLFQLDVPLKGTLLNGEEVEATLVFASSVRASRLQGLSNFPQDETMIFAADEFGEFSAAVPLATFAGRFNTFQAIRDLGYEIIL